MNKLQDQSRANGGTYNTNQFSSIDGVTPSQSANGGETYKKYYKRDRRDSDSEDDQYSDNQTNYQQET